jgi:hypothetical protein
MFAAVAARKNGKQGQGFVRCEVTRMTCRLVAKKAEICAGRLAWCAASRLRSMARCSAVGVSQLPPAEAAHTTATAYSIHLLLQTAAQQEEPVVAARQNVR